MTLACPICGIELQIDKVRRWQRRSTSLETEFEEIFWCMDCDIYYTLSDLKAIIYNQ
jgi:uncharacterized protein YbaR (Trm112 family)